MGNQNETRAERKIKALQARLAELESAVDGIKTKEEDHYFSDATVFAVILFLSFVVMAVAFAFVWAKNYRMAAAQGFELLSYVLPSLAGIIGGFGIYFKKLPALFFSMAALLVIGGLVFFMLSKQEELRVAGDPHQGFWVVTLLTVGVELVVAACALVVMNLARDGARFKRLNVGQKVLRIFYLLLLVVAMLACFFYAKLAMSAASGTEKSSTPCHANHHDDERDSQRK